MIHKTTNITAKEIAELRVAIDWDALEAEHVASLPKLFAQYAARDNNNQLIAYAAAISDGVMYALLVNVMVMPAHQNKGFGKQLVCFALQDLHAIGIRNVGALFNPKLQNFYAQCGMESMAGGYSRINN